MRRLRTRKRPVEGSLFLHTRPQNHLGLRTITARSAEEKEWSGWDGQLLPSYFLVLDLNWWVR